MGRNQHTNDVLPKVEAEIEKINTDGTLPPGAQVPSSRALADQWGCSRVTASDALRALARDVGAALGVGGHLTALRRTRVGAFDLGAARTLAESKKFVALVTLGGLLRGEQFAALRGEFLHHGIFQRVHQMRREAGLHGVQQRVDARRRQRLRFAVQNF